MEKCCAQKDPKTFPKQKDTERMEMLLRISEEFKRYLDKSNKHYRQNNDLYNRYKEKNIEFFFLYFTAELESRIEKFWRKAAQELLLPIKKINPFNELTKLYASDKRNKLDSGDRIFMQRRIQIVENILNNVIDHKNAENMNFLLGVIEDYIYVLQLEEEFYRQKLFNKKSDNKQRDEENVEEDDEDISPWVVLGFSNTDKCDLESNARFARLQKNKAESIIKQQLFYYKSKKNKIEILEIIQTLKEINEFSTEKAVLRYIKTYEKYDKSIYEFYDSSVRKDIKSGKIKIDKNVYDLLSDNAKQTYFEDVLVKDAITNRIIGIFNKRPNRKKRK